jgi:hypothetical protein
VGAAVRQLLGPWYRRAIGIFGSKTFTADEWTPSPDVLDESLNHCGRTRAMTAFTLVKPWYRPPGGTLILRAVFWYARRSVRRKGAETIDRLSFIHFARWGLIDRLPDLGQPPEELRQPIFMFESNYNGTFDQYIDSFANILTTGMRLFWGTSYGFTKPKPVTRFMSYIHANEYVAEHYYSAYPTATTTMVTSALTLDQAHRHFHLAAQTLTPEQFAVRFEEFLTKQQAQL